LQATIEFPGPIKKDDFVKKIMAIVEQFLLNHENKLPSPTIIVSAKSAIEEEEWFSRGAVINLT
jgi:hypothetical protein